MPTSRAPDARPRARRLLNALATARAIASLAAISILAGGLALVVVPAAFVAVGCLNVLNAVKPIEIDRGIRP
jgi:hypothetical protein